MGPPSRMVTIGLAATEEEAQEAAAYFSSFAFRPWIRVVETDMVPVTRVSGWMHVPVEGAAWSPSASASSRRQRTSRGRGYAIPRPASSPTCRPGAVARGEALVTTGGDGRTVACGVCHGPDLRGLGPVPHLAGRSPSYVARQLYDFQTRTRNGAWSDLMDAAVANLTVADIVDIAAYTASLDP